MRTGTMDRRETRPIRLLVPLLGLPALLLILPIAAAAAPALDLMGTWYVLIHYKDAGTANPEADRWDDKVWVFAEKGSRLSWTEYATVVFADPQGRFERTLSGEPSRVLAAWEPNATQLREIKAGLEADSSAARTKTLRGSPSKGYKSPGALRTQSVSVIGFHETWSIEGLAEAPVLPVFTRDDLMGSGRTSKMEGRTQYASTAVLEDGTLLRGVFERDGTRRGSFRMMRTGDVAKGGGKKRRVQSVRPYTKVFGASESRRQIEALASQVDALGDPQLQELRVHLRASIGRSLSAFGLRGSVLDRRTESLSSQVEGLLLEQGLSPDEVDEMARQGKIRP